VASRSAVAVIKAEADRHAANVVPIIREARALAQKLCGM